MPKKKSEPLNFEESLDKLQQLVESMEQGELSLEQSLKAFEEGVKLARECQSELKTAEQKVKILIEENMEDELEDFPMDDDEFDED